MAHNEDKNVLVYLLAGFGLGVLLGVAAGLLFAPKPGAETREELLGKLKDYKQKAGDWVSEQKAKRAAKTAAEDVGA